MPRVRLFLIVAAVLFALSAAPAWAAARPSTVTYPQTLTSPHFVVHYTTDSAAGDRIDETLAADAAAEAERAYDLFVTQWGYPAPLDDGDAHTDIYVITLTGHRSLALPVPGGDSAMSTPAFIEVDRTNGITLHHVAHAVFNAIQFGVWNPTNRSLVEGAAERAAYALDGYAGFTAGTGSFDVSLDCYDTNFPFPNPGHNCDGTTTFSSDEGTIGSARWPFYELLAERYGDTAPLTVLQAGAASGSRATTISSLLDAYLGTKGTSLASFYNEWARVTMSGAYTAVPLQIYKPTLAQSMLTGTLASLNSNRDPSLPILKTGALPTLNVSVNHLGVRYVGLVRGDGIDSGPCYAATLSLSVKIPAGTNSQPAFQWQERNAYGALVQATLLFDVSGSTASATIPWDTCKWASTVGYVALPNASSTVDAANFELSGTIKIDTSSVGAASSPPTPVVMPGQVVNAPSVDGVPTIELRAPLTIHLPADEPTLRVIVTSSGPGSLKLSLGLTVLGVVPLRTGNNDVRVPVSASLRVPGNIRTLLLTPLATEGGTGTALARTVEIDSADDSPSRVVTAKAKAKAKAAKAKAKAAKARRQAARR
jgi:hypothetical protein